MGCDCGGRKPLVKLVWLWGHFLFSVYPADEYNPSHAFLAIGGYPFPEFAVWLTTGVSFGVDVDVGNNGILFIVRLGLFNIKLAWDSPMWFWKALSRTGTRGWDE